MQRVTLCEKDYLEHLAVVQSVAASAEELSAEESEAVALRDATEKTWEEEMKKMKMLFHPGLH